MSRRVSLGRHPNLIGRGRNPRNGRGCRPNNVGRGCHLSNGWGRRSSNVGRGHHPSNETLLQQCRSRTPPQQRPEMPIQQCRPRTRPRHPSQSARDVPSAMAGNTTSGEVLPAMSTRDVVPTATSPANTTGMVACTATHPGELPAESSFFCYTNLFRLILKLSLLSGRSHSTPLFPNIRNPVK